MKKSSDYNSVCSLKLYVKTSSIVLGEYTDSEIPITNQAIEYIYIVIILSLPSLTLSKPLMFQVSTGL